MGKQLAFLQPQIAYLEAIRAELPDNGIFVDELTQLGYVGRMVFPVYRPRTFISPGYQGTLGWGVATALGVKIGRPEAPVVAVSGDGGFLFTAQELATAVQFRIPVVIVLVNDGAYGNVRRIQADQFGNRLIACDLRNPDFQKYVESFGAMALRATSPETLREALRTAFKGRHTCIDPDPGRTDARPVDGHPAVAEPTSAVTRGTLPRTHWSKGPGD